MKRIRIDITHGDFNGIGYEIILKSLADDNLLKLYTPVLYGKKHLVDEYTRLLGCKPLTFEQNSKKTFAEGKNHLVELTPSSDVDLAVGQVTEDAGKLALLSLQEGVKDLRNGLIDALVTAPINKENIPLKNFIGQTEWLSQELEANAKDELMMMVSDKLRVSLVTTHKPINEVAQLITPKNVSKTICKTSEILRKDFLIEAAKIAILGLNPHAQGEEENNIINPTIENLRSKGVFLSNALSADGFFGEGHFKDFDAIVAMFHDQGLIPFKMLADGDGVNYTGGLPFVRTSPSHGTAMNIAGKGKADHRSFLSAIHKAVEIVQNRGK